MVATRWDKKTGEWAGKRGRAGEDFLEGGRAFAEGGFRKEQKEAARRGKRVFSAVDLKLGGELEMRGFGRWKS